MTIERFEEIMDDDNIKTKFPEGKNNVYEQRLVVEKYLDPKWVVHHINEKKDDNRIENLICFVSNLAHRRFHGNPNNVKDNEIIFDGRVI